MNKCNILPGANRTDDRFDSENAKKALLRQHQGVYLTAAFSLLAYSVVLTEQFIPNKKIISYVGYAGLGFTSLTIIFFCLLVFTPL